MKVLLWKVIWKVQVQLQVQLTSSVPQNRNVMLTCYLPAQKVLLFVLEFLKDIDLLLKVS